MQMTLAYYQASGTGGIQTDLEERLPALSVRRFGNLEDFLSFIATPMVLADNLFLLVISSSQEIQRLHNSNFFGLDQVTLLIDLGEDSKVYRQTHLLSPRITLYGRQEPCTVADLVEALARQHLKAGFGNTLGLRSSKAMDHGQIMPFNRIAQK
jgi:hypothetical protein